MYTVIKDFKDRFDGGRAYKTGDTYPRKGFSPHAGRAEALAINAVSKLNRTGGIYLELESAAEKITCPVCGKEYKSEAALASHIADKHPEPIPE